MGCCGGGHYNNYDKRQTDHCSGQNDKESTIIEKLIPIMAILIVGLFIYYYII